MITHTLRFFCLWYSTIVSFPFISYTTIHETSRILQWLLLYYQESSNRCSQDRIRTYVTTSLYGVVLTITPPDYIFGGPSRLRSEGLSVTGTNVTITPMDLTCSLYGNRTRDFAVKGRRLNPLSNRPFYILFINFIISSTVSVTENPPLL